MTAKPTMLDAVKIQARVVIPIVKALERELCSAAPAFPRAIGDTTIKLEIKVVPGSSRNGIAGWLGETLKVRVTARPERGKANAAVEQAIADALGLPRRCTRVVAGKTSARKVVEISGLSESEVYRRLSKGVA